MPDKLKVLIITERFHPEEFIINDLAAEWAAGDFKVDVLTQAPSYPSGKIFPGYSNSVFSGSQWNNIRIRRFFTITGYRDNLFLKLLGYFSFAVIGTIIAVLIGRKYDRIFIYHVGPLSMALPAVLAGKIHKKDVTIWTQDVWPDTVYAYGFRKTKILSVVLDRYVSFIYRNCARIFVSCEGFKAKIAPYACGKPILYFPNWPTISPASDNEGIRLKLSKKFNFTFAGNIGKVQNLENVIRGFAMAALENPDIQLNIVGDGSQLQYLKEIVETENIKNVSFWGRKKLEEMPAFFNASDVMVIALKDAPIFNITVPAKFQAYLAFSKPVFCVMSGEVREIVEKCRTGLCADPGDLEDIKAGFLKFYELKDGGLEKFAENSKGLLDGVYNKTKIVSSMSEILAAGTR